MGFSFGLEHSDFRNPLAELFQALDAHPSYQVRVRQTHVEVYYQAEKLGGLDRSRWHFYLSVVFVRNHQAQELVGSLGFKLEGQSGSHQYWRLKGIQDHHAFREAIEIITQSPIFS